VFTNLEDTEGDGLVDRHGGADTHPDGVEGTDQEDGGRDRSSERVLELVDGFQKRNGDQTNRDGSHGQNAQQFVRDDSQRVESREKVPLRQDFQRSGERIRRLTQLSRFHNRQGDGQRDGTQDDDRENVQQIVRPRRFTVVVVTHTLRELGSQHRVGQVRLLGDGVGDDQGARLGGFDAAMMMMIQTEKYRRSVSDRTNEERVRGREEEEQTEKMRLRKKALKEKSQSRSSPLSAPLSFDDDGFISFPIRIKNTIVCFRATRERVSRQTRSPFATTRIGARDSTKLFLVLSLETSPERIFRARDWAFIFRSPSRRKERYEFFSKAEKRRKTGDVIQKRKKSRSKSTPYLNGANGMAFDTDAFALLTDFVKVGRAVETAEDAWMANIFMSKVCFL